MNLTKELANTESFFIDGRKNARKRVNIPANEFGKAFSLLVHTMNIFAFQLTIAHAVQSHSNFSFFITSNSFRIYQIAFHYATNGIISHIKVHEFNLEIQHGNSVCWI